MGELYTAASWSVDVTAKRSKGGDALVVGRPARETLRFGWVESKVLAKHITPTRS